MTTSHWGTTPRQSIAAEVARRGRANVVSGCRALLRGEPVDAELIMALAGPASAPFLAGEARDDDYWLRVWGARGLLWEWDAAAVPEATRALDDPSWRVREMVLLVIKHNRVAGLEPLIDPLRADPVLRVRRAAEKALVALAVTPPPDASTP